METEIQLKELLIDDGQAEQFAYAIFNDISEYLIQNETKFASWFFGIALDILESTIITLEFGITTRTNYNYALCNYKK